MSVRRRGSGIYIKLTLDLAQQGYIVLLDRKNIAPLCPLLLIIITKLGFVGNSYDFSRVFGFDGGSNG